MHQRKHIRLRDYDYSSANAYFITICVKDFEHLFGYVHNGIVRFSDIGNAACIKLQEIPLNRPNVALNEFIVMPNHVHCIIEIMHRHVWEQRMNKFSKPVSNSISMIINHYKGAVKKWCNQNGFPHFDWHGRFHDHVIRNNEAFENIKHYIAENPRNWQKDRFFRRDMPTACPSSQSEYPSSLPG